MVKDDSQFSTGHPGRVMPENKMQQRSWPCRDSGVDASGSATIGI